MNPQFDLSRAPSPRTPQRNPAWNIYSQGVESIGRNGKPDNAAVPTPAADQLLVRVDAVGLCFSDVKLIKLGGKHPSLYDRDLAHDPTRLGHEAALAGDALVAGVVWALSSQRVGAEIIRWGVACGAGAASLDGTAMGQRSLVACLATQVRVTLYSSPEIQEPERRSNEIKRDSCGPF